MDGYPEQAPDGAAMAQLAEEIRKLEQNRLVVTAAVAGSAAFVVPMLYFVLELRLFLVVLPIYALSEIAGIAFIWKTLSAKIEALRGNTQ
jgi:hypothetical protein